jgi:glutathione S-transferase
MVLTLHGFKFSVYSWIARLALHEKGLTYDWVEVDPFIDPLPDWYLSLQPFGRVPALSHASIVIYETAAITRYVDEAFEGPPLQAEHAFGRARTSQIISVIDNYAYWPLVRQVFSHDVFRPAFRRDSDTVEVDRGMMAAARVLHALETLASGGPYLVADRLTLADIHLAPMLIYFNKSARGAEVLSTFPKLSDWLQAILERSAVRETTPILPS